MTNYPAKNGHIVLIIGRLPINVSVQFLGILVFFRNSGLFFIENLQASNVTTGLGHADTTNQNCGVILRGPYSMLGFPWVNNLPAHPDYIPKSPENPRAAARRIRDDVLHRRRRELMRSPTTSCNPIVNPRVHCRDDNW